LPTLDAPLTATEKTDVAPLTTFVVKVDSTAPRPVVVVAVLFLVNMFTDLGKNGPHVVAVMLLVVVAVTVASVDVELIVTALPKEFVVVIMTTVMLPVVEGARSALIPDSRAAI